MINLCRQFVVVKKTDYHRKVQHFHSDIVHQIADACNAEMIGMVADAGRIKCELDGSEVPPHLKTLYNKTTLKLRDTTRSCCDILFETTDLFGEGVYLQMLDSLKRLNEMCDMIEKEMREFDFRMKVFNICDELGLERTNSNITAIGIDLAEQGDEVARDCMRDD